MVWLVDLAILLALAEGVLLALWHRRTGHGLPGVAVAPNLLSGLALLLALRVSMIGAAGRWIGLWLLVALVAHAVDLRRRWRKES